MNTEPQVRVDYLRADLDGFVTVEVEALPPDAAEHAYLVVGDDDAEPRVARVVEIRGELATLRILRGSVEENKDLLEPTASTTS